jgi:hypothetical protein
LQTVDRQQNSFRIQHGLQDKFAIMYSGNHSPANPLNTLLQAAVRLKDSTIRKPASASSAAALEEGRSLHPRLQPRQRYLPA